MKKNLKKPLILFTSVLPVFTLCACFGGSSNISEINYDVDDDIYNDIEDYDEDYDEDDYSDDDYDEDDYSDYDEDDYGDDGDYSYEIDVDSQVLTDTEWSYDDNIFIVGKYIYFAADHSYSIYSGGGGDSEDGTFTFDGSTIFLHGNDGTEKEMVLQEDTLIIDWEGNEIRPYEAWAEVRGEEDPESRFFYMWIYEKDADAGYYDRYYAFYPDHTWYFTANGGESYEVSGTFEINGKGHLILHFDDGKEDFEFKYNEQDFVLVDQYDDTLRIFAPIR